MSAEEFTTAEKMSPLWGKWIAYLDARLAILRTQNDVPASEGDTAIRRGRIAEIKRLLSLDKTLPELE